MFNFLSGLFIFIQEWVTISCRLILLFWGTRILLTKSTNSGLKFFYFKTNINTSITVKIEVPCLYVFHNIVISHSIHRWLSSNQHEKNDSQRPDITSLIIRSWKYLRSHVVSSPNQSPLTFLLIQLLFKIFLPSKR